MQLSSPQFSGLRDVYARRNPASRLKYSQKELAHQAEQKKLEEENRQWQELAGQIQDALSTELFQDKFGAFRGWDLLKLVPRLQERNRYSDYRGQTTSSVLKEKLSGLVEWGTAKTVLDKMISLKLLESATSYYRETGYALTPRGEKALKLFKKQFKKSWLPIKQGNFTFNPKDLK